MSDNDTRILILQQKLAESKMHPSERDALADDLQFAHQINGDTDPIKQMLKTITISGVRRELLAHDRQARHYANCPIASQITEDDKGNKIMPWQKADQDIVSTVSQDTSTISGFGVTLKGPVTRLVIFGLIIIGAVWIIVNRNNTAMQKDINDKLLPAIMQTIKAQQGLSQTNNTKGDTP